MSPVSAHIQTKSTETLDVWSRNSSYDRALGGAIAAPQTPGLAVLQNDVLAG